MEKGQDFCKREMEILWTEIHQKWNALFLRKLSLVQKCQYGTFESLHGFSFLKCPPITIKEFQYLLTFPACYIPIIFPIWIIIAITSVNKFLFQRMFWPFTVQTYCSSVLKIFANSQTSASNFKRFSWSLEFFFLPEGQNNFGNKMQVLGFIQFKRMIWMNSGHQIAVHIFEYFSRFSF